MKILVTVSVVSRSFHFVPARFDRTSLWRDRYRRNKTEGPGTKWDALERNGTVHFRLVTVTFSFKNERIIVRLFNQHLNKIYIYILVLLKSFWVFSFSIISWSWLKYRFYCNLQLNEKILFQTEVLIASNIMKNY